MTTQPDEIDTTPEATDAAPADAVASQDGSSDAETGATKTEGGVALLEREGDIAADYLEALLDIADLDGDIDIDVEADRASVSIIGEGLGGLIGPGGSTLDALQELTRLAVYRETGVRSRLMLDVGGHRARRRSELAQLGREAAERVLASGEPERLAPMTPFERKVVHDAVTATEGVKSESEGEEPQRRIVVSPA
ncbi:MAG TPA: R3H domain-containing nucleic acid-binding protein [Mycobacteriales bacterium]|nr:R3H domain-containing nucleic acid-binding protein [Mycobacteriales bacterium]